MAHNADDAFAMQTHAKFAAIAWLDDNDGTLPGLRGKPTLLQMRRKTTKVVFATNGPTSVQAQRPM